MLKDKPKHWLGYFDGSLWANLESPRGFKPRHDRGSNPRDQRLYTYRKRIIDEACGGVFDYLRTRGWDAQTDIVFTTDHGELQGDYGLLFKGAYHVDSLMRLPLIWRPAPDANIAAAEVSAPVGHVDLAQTFAKLRASQNRNGSKVRPCQFRRLRLKLNSANVCLQNPESEHGPVSLNLQSIYSDKWVCTRYGKSCCTKAQRVSCITSPKTPARW